MNSLIGEFFVGGTRGPPLKNAMGDFLLTCLGRVACSDVFLKVKGASVAACHARALVDRALHHSQQFFDLLILEFAAVADAEGDGAGRLLLLADDEEGGNFLELAVPDLRAQLLVPRGRSTRAARPLLPF